MYVMYCTHEMHVCGGQEPTDDHFHLAAHSILFRLAGILGQVFTKLDRCTTRALQARPLIALISKASHLKKSPDSWPELTWVI